MSTTRHPVLRTAQTDPAAADQSRRRGGGGPSVWMARQRCLLRLLLARPLLGVLVLSFMHWDGLGTPTWAGGDNWAEVLADPVSRTAMWLTVQLRC